jgi:hypothetical protein
VAADLFGNHVPLEISAQVYATFSLTIKPLNNYLMFSRHSAACPACNSRPIPVKWKMNYGTCSDLCPYTGDILTKIRHLKIPNKCQFSSSMLEIVGFL